MREISFKGLIFRKDHFDKGFIRIKGDKIISEESSGDFVEVDYIIPQFIEAHIHGGWNYNFQKGDFEELENILIKKGFDIVIPTLMNDSLDNLIKIAEKFRKYREKNPESIFPFLRVEGPFISEEKRGAQEIGSILKPTLENIEKFLKIEEIKTFTFAPEIPNSEILIKEALEKGKIPSFGHSNAGFKDFERIYKMGVCHMTHFPNAMSPLHHREIGLTGAGFLFDLDIEIIADSVHTSLDFLKLFYKIKGSKFSIVSDLIPLAYPENKQKKLVDKKGMLIGGATLISEQIKILKKTGIKVDEIIKIATINSRKFFKFPIPELREGEEASFLILDKKLNVKRIIHKGKEIV